jgi:hypothetical protein
MGDYIRWNGVTLRVFDESRNETCIVPKNRWAEVVEMQTTTRRGSWKEAPQEVDVYAARFKPIVDGRFAERGVIMLNHEPTEAEKKHLSETSFHTNMMFRKRHIENFESQRKAAEARQGTYEPTPYVDECYDLLQMRKPYSMEAMRAQRDPGREAAIDIAKAMKDAQLEGAKAIVDMLNRPPEPVGAVHKR